MVTITGTRNPAGFANATVFDLTGLSTDTKPIEKFNGKKLTNGSSFFEMDTASAYMYDEAGKTWKKL